MKPENDIRHFFEIDIQEIQTASNGIEGRNLIDNKISEGWWYVHKKAKGVSGGMSAVAGGVPERHISYSGSRRCRPVFNIDNLLQNTVCNARGGSQKSGNV